MNTDCKVEEMKVEEIIQAIESENFGDPAVWDEACRV